MTVNNDHLEYWNVTEEDLLALARRNVKRLLPAELFTMQQAVDEILRTVPGRRKNLLNESAAEADDFMYVLSNPIRSFGAACIVYPEVLDMAGQILGEDYYGTTPAASTRSCLCPRQRAWSRRRWMRWSQRSTRPR